MDDATFWSLIDRARSEGADPQTPSADPERLRAILEGEPDATVAAFGLRIVEEVARLNRWAVWGAGYVIDGGMSGDRFHYFRAWLVGKGKDAVEQALRDPDGLVAYVTPEDDLWNEALEYVAVEIMETRGGEDPRDAFVGERGPDEPEGEPFDEDTATTPTRASRRRSASR